MGHGLLHGKHTVQQPNGGDPHDPPQRLPQAPAQGQATPPRKNPRATPMGAGARTAPCAGLGRGSPGAGPARDGRRRGAVAATGPAEALEPNLWADVSPFFGCCSYHELCRVRGWDKNLPGRILAAWPKRKWLRRLQRLGQELLVRLWPHSEDKSPATRRRWQWTWVGDDSVCKKSGQPLGLVGTW